MLYSESVIKFNNNNNNKYSQSRAYTLVSRCGNTYHLAGFLRTLLQMPRTDIILKFQTPGHDAQEPVLWIVAGYANLPQLFWLAI